MSVTVEGAPEVKNCAVEPGHAAGAAFDRLGVAAVVEAYDVTATGQVITGACLVVGMETLVAGTSSTLTLYDNTAASGKLVMPAIPTGTVNVLGYQRSFAQGGAVLCVNGLHAVVGGTGATFRILAIPSQP